MLTIAEETGTLGHYKPTDKVALNAISSGLRGSHVGRTIRQRQERDHVGKLFSVIPTN